MNLLDLPTLLLGAVGGSLAVYLFMHVRFKKQEQELLTAQTLLSNEQDKSLAIEKIEKQLKDTFGAAAADALKNNNEAFIQLAQQTFQTQHESAKGELDQRAKSVSESLERFDKNLSQLHKAHGGLMSRIDGLGKETENLVSALQTPKVIGNWGEMQLRKVAEIAGMEEHCDFDVQKNISTDESRLYPDMIVRLPGGRSIAVDSKVPLKHFLASFDTESEEERTACLEQHRRSVREHAKELGSKAYWDHLEDTPDFVVMYLGDAVYQAAIQVDPHLPEDALRNHVILAPPSILIMALRTIAYSWRQEKFSEHAREISSLGKELYERLKTLSEHFDGIKKGLARAVKSYNSAAGSLESRIFVTARKFQDFGINPDVTLTSPPPVEETPRALSAPEFHETVSDEETSDD